jgi:hypothetical protein
MLVSICFLVLCAAVALIARLAGAPSPVIGVAASMVIVAAIAYRSIRNKP